MKRNAFITTVRRLLLALFLLGVLGTGADLILLEHTEEFWQWVPLALMGLSLVCVGLLFGYQKPASLYLFRAVLGLFVVSGLVGLYLHYAGNVEFELEMYPTLEGLALFGKAIQGATPALAPGAMIQLGLLGLLYTWRHPLLPGPPEAQATA